MGFDKNTVIGIVLIMLIFFGFEIYNVKQQAEYEKTHPKSKTDASKYPTGDSAKNNANDTIPVTANTPAELTKVTDSVINQNLGNFAAFAQGNEQIITIENEDCIYTFSNKGGVIKKVELKGYKTSTKKPLILFEDHGADFFRQFGAQGEKFFFQLRAILCLRTQRNTEYQRAAESKTQ